MDRLHSSEFEECYVKTIRHGKICLDILGKSKKCSSCKSEAHIDPQEAHECPKCDALFAARLAT